MTKEQKISSGIKIAFATNGAGSTGGQHAEECELIHPCLLVLSSSSSGSKHPHKPDTLKLIEKKLGKTLEDMGTGENFLNRT